MCSSQEDRTFGHVQKPQRKWIKLADDNGSESMLWNYKMTCSSSGPCFTSSLCCEYTIGKERNPGAYKIFSDIGRNAMDKFSPIAFLPM